MRSLTGSEYSRKTLRLRRRTTLSGNMANVCSQCCSSRWPGQRGEKNEHQCASRSGHEGADLMLWLFATSGYNGEGLVASVFARNYLSYNMRINGSSLTTRVEPR
jgi:hypothetical protein